MAQRVGILNGSNLAQDKDLGALADLLLYGNSVIANGLAVTSGSVAPGRALIQCVRTSTTPNEDVWVVFENTSAVAIDTTGTKKVYIEITQANINDGTLNTDVTGAGIGLIKTGASYPSTNYIPLASITGGVITDARPKIDTISTALQNQKHTYVASTGSSNAYAISLTPAPTTYAEGQKFAFKANFANTASPTINVNGLGAKNIYLPNGVSTLNAGDIKSGQIVEVEYDGTNFQMVSPIGQAPQVSVGFMAKSAYAGEALTTGDALTFEAIHQDTKAIITTNAVGDQTANTKRAVSLISNGVAVTGIKLYLSKTGAPTDNFTIRIETDNAGAPSGTLVHANASATVAGTALTTTQTDTAITFTSFTPTAGTKCWLVLGRSNGAMDASNYYNVGYKAEATRAFANKTYNGSAWQASTFTQTIYCFQTSQLFATVAVKASALLQKFMRVEGFAANTYAWGATASIVSGRSVGVFSGLTVNGTYYLSDTYGTISTTPGTNTVLIGTAFNATTILDTDENVFATAVVGTTVKAGDTVLAGPSGQKSASANPGSMQKAFETTCLQTGTYRIKFTIEVQGGSNYASANGQIYKNGVAFGTLRSLSSYGATQEWAEDLAFTNGDLIQIYWQKTDGYGYSVYVRNFQVCASLVPVALAGSITTY